MGRVLTGVTLAHHDFKEHRGTGSVKISEPMESRGAADGNGLAPVSTEAVTP